tara:strand:- start:60 stop:290 length:231 start_codon:yes stop_codon:yes gene_type:complete
MNEKLTTDSKLCNECSKPMDDYVEVKGHDHLTNQEFYNDVPFCSNCFEKEAQQQDGLEVGRMKILNTFKTEVLGIK